jgi:hypothetical protein
VLSLVRSPVSISTKSYNPHTPALAPELGRAYSSQLRAPTREGDTRLRDVVVALVRRLKEDGLPPERAIVAIKAAIVRYGDDRRPPSLAVEEDGRFSPNPIYERLFQWILAAYFGGPA